MWSLNIGSKFIDEYKIFVTFEIYDIDVLVQERRNSIAIELELHLSCTNPSIYCIQYHYLNLISMILHIQILGNCNRSKYIEYVNSLEPNSNDWIKTNHNQSHLWCLFLDQFIPRSGFSSSVP